MARQIQFATMVAMASFISAPEFLLAQTLTPETDLMPPVDPPAWVRGGHGLSAAGTSACQPVPGSENWQIGDSAHPAAASAEDACLKLLLAQVPLQP